MAEDRSFHFVNYLWDDAKAASLNPVDRLVYRSNILGADQRITNTGGGNTSAKFDEIDPLTGKSVRVLWGQRLGRRSSDSEARPVLVPVLGQADLPSGHLR